MAECPFCDNTHPHDPDECAAEQYCDSTWGVGYSHATFKLLITRVFRTLREAAGELGPFMRSDVPDEVGSWSDALNDTIKQAVKR